MKFKDLRSTEDISNATNLSTARILQLKYKIINANLAVQIGKTMVYHKKTINWLKNREDKRGKWKRK